MKKTIYFLFNFLIIATLFTNSCKKLDQINPSGTPSNQVFSDSTSFIEAVNGLYNTLGAKEYYGAYYLMLSDLNSDDGIAGGYNNSSLNEFGNYSVGSSNLFLENTYVAMYNCLRASNAILTALPNATGSSSPMGATRSQITGTCLAIRGLVHFDLLRAFGYHWDLNSKYGIPLVLTNQSIGQIVPRSNVSDTYKAILNDLNQAEDSLRSLTGRDPSFMNVRTVQALKARVYLYMKDYPNAINMADSVIGDPSYQVLNSTTFPTIYSSRKSAESIFELAFSQQDQSFYNFYTYSRPDAASTEIFFIASNNLVNFLVNRSNDLRLNLLENDAQDSTSNFFPNGRTLKYLGSIVRDNPAYILRISEMYLIRAEASGLSSQGLADLNMIRTNRGMSALQMSDIGNASNYSQVIADELRSEFNFEGHRYFDLARNQTLSSVLTNELQVNIPLSNSCWPIPIAEINATHGSLIQNPGY